MGLPDCGNSPVRESGFLSYAPALSEQSDGYRADAHHVFDQAQERHFWFRERNRLLANLARRWFGKARKVFEIGCGTGYAMSGLREALPAAELSGSEIHTVGLQYASQRLEHGVQLYQMDANAIPFTEEFDLIAACDVLEHLEDDNHVLREIYRALKTGGGILLTVPQHPLLWSQADVYACHKRRYSRRELAEKCERAGFRVVVDTSFVFGLLPIMMAQRLIRAHRDYDFESELSIGPFLNGLFLLVLRLENLLIELGVRFPVGGSRVIVAFKDDVRQDRP